MSTGPNQVVRLTQPVAGRWGEAQSVPGSPAVESGDRSADQPSRSKLTITGYAQAISIDISDLRLGGIPRDAADDNYNSFDPYPPATPTYNRQGEVNDLDFLDPAGAFLLPVERMRRFLAPADINGTGRVLQWNGTSGWTYSTPNYSDVGNDQWGRVAHYSYFRPPGLPGLVTPTQNPQPPGTIPDAVTFPWTSGENYPSNVVTPNVASNNSHNNNPLHGFESFAVPQPGLRRKLHAAADGRGSG